MAFGKGERINCHGLTGFNNRKAREAALLVDSHQAGAACLQTAAEAPEAEGIIYLLLNPVQQNQHGCFLCDVYSILLVAGLRVEVRVESENPRGDDFVHVKPL